jgi:hypothetical protein
MVESKNKLQTALAAGISSAIIKSLKLKVKTSKA